MAEEVLQQTTIKETDGGKRGINFKKFIPLLVLLLAGGILFGIAGGWNRFVGGGSTQRTDDAFLRADITPLSTRVSGTVAQVAVTDYQRVKAGDLLVQLKDDDFKAQVAQAGLASPERKQHSRTTRNKKNYRLPESCRHRRE
jgi:multidrug resistance efflux pump